MLTKINLDKTMRNKNNLMTSPVDINMPQPIPNQDAIQDQYIPPTPDTFDPTIKVSGAPVNFNPNSMNNMKGMFGAPIADSYDRVMGNDQTMN